MRILVTNDDGIYSPGIKALAKIATKFGEVRMVAPNVEQSSMGHAITATRPLSYEKTKIDEFDAYRVNGTPADCVAMGAYHWGKVDVVLSGINLGLNLGNALWHSGTLAAAKQAALLGIKGIAFSSPAKTGFEDAKFLPYVEKCLSHLLEDHTMPLININFPLHPKGVRWTRQSVRHYDGNIVPGEDPMGRKHFWFTVKPIESTDPDTDRWALEHSFVSVMPLRLDLTDEDALARAKEEFKDME